MRRELSTDESEFGDSHRALELLSGERGQVTLLLHPDDMAAVTDAWADDLGSLEEPAPTLFVGVVKFREMIRWLMQLLKPSYEIQLWILLAYLALSVLPESRRLLDRTEVESTINRLEAGGNDSE